MLEIRSSKKQMVLALAIVVAALASFQPTIRAEDEQNVTIHILVTDAETGKPINQARLTLQFEEETRTMMVRHTKPHSFSATTNPQGKYRFTDIPKGTVRLLVTADHHMSWGTSVEIEKDGQQIDVKLKKPQPQL